MKTIVDRNCQIAVVTTDILISKLPIVLLQQRQIFYNYDYRHSSNFSNTLQFLSA